MSVDHPTMHCTTNQQTGTVSSTIHRTRRCDVILGHWPWYEGMYASSAQQSHKKEDIFSSRPLWGRGTLSGCWGYAVRSPDTPLRRTPPLDGIQAPSPRHRFGSVIPSPTAHSYFQRVYPGAWISTPASKCRPMLSPSRYGARVFSLPPSVPLTLPSSLDHASGHQVNEAAALYVPRGVYSYGFNYIS